MTTQKTEEKPFHKLYCKYPKCRTSQNVKEILHKLYVSNYQGT